MAHTYREVDLMAVIRNSVVLRCSPEVVFDYLSDHRAELDWNPKCEVMEKLTDGPVGLGTKYRAKWKSSPYVELETMAFDRPRSWTMHNGGPIDSGQSKIPVGGHFISLSMDS